jgi:hypothetical protein
MMPPFEHSVSTRHASPRIRSVSLPPTRSLRGLRDVPQSFRPRALSRARRCRSRDPRCRKCRRSGDRHPDAADRRRCCGSAGTGTHEHLGARHLVREIPGAAGDRVCVGVSRGDARIAGSGSVRSATRGASRLRRSASCVPRDRRPGARGYGKRKPARTARTSPGQASRTARCGDHDPVPGASHCARVRGARTTGRHAATDVLACPAASRARIRAVVCARRAGDPGLSLSAGWFGSGRGCRSAAGLWDAGCPRTRHPGCHRVPAHGPGPDCGSGCPRRGGREATDETTDETGHGRLSPSYQTYTSAADQRCGRTRRHRHRRGEAAPAACGLRCPTGIRVPSALYIVLWRSCACNLGGQWCTSGRRSPATPRSRSHTRSRSTARTWASSNAARPTLPWTSSNASPASSRSLPLGSCQTPTDQSG